MEECSVGLTWILMSMNGTGTMLVHYESSSVKSESNKISSVVGPQQEAAPNRRRREVN